MDAYTIGKRIKLLREEQNLTQEHMARELGIAPSTYSEPEGGKHKFDMDRLERIARIFNRPVTDLITPGNFVLNIQDNHHNTNVGYTQVEQQHMVPESLMDRLLSAHERLIAIVERHFGKEK